MFPDWILFHANWHTTAWLLQGGTEGIPRAHRGFCPAQNPSVPQRCPLLHGKGRRRGLQTTGWFDFLKDLFRVTLRRQQGHPESFGFKPSPGTASPRDFCNGLLDSQTETLPEILSKTPTFVLRSGGSGQCYQPSFNLEPPDKLVPLK